MVRPVNKTYLLRLTSFAKGKAHGFGTTILILFSIFLLIMGKVNENSLSIFKSYFLDISSGILSLIGKPVNSVSDGFYKINDIVFLYSENQNLKQENESLNKWKDLALKLLIENEELKKLLNSANVDRQKFTTAKVISNSGGSYVKTITINIGSNHGVKVGNPVLNNWGMIGRVVDLGKNASRVLLTVDINSQIPVYFEKSLHRAILVGNNSNMLELKFLKKRVLLADKDRLMTSGEGGVLPRGLPVGVFSKELNQDRDKLIVIPSKNWDKLSLLKVILYDYDKNF